MQGRLPSSVAFQQQVPRRLPGVRFGPRLASRALPLAILFLSFVTRGTAQATVPQVTENLNYTTSGFGWTEFQRAMEQRGVNPASFRVAVEYSMSLPADGYRIQPSLILGGSRRGLMYGLLAAARQLRERGSLLSVTAMPRFEIRAVRLMLTDELLARSTGEWQNLFENLAKARINRLRLEMTELTPSRSAGIGVLARFAEQYAVDLALGIDEVDTPLLMKTMSQSIAMKAVHVHSGSAAMALSTLSEVGRYVTLDLDAPDITETMKQHAAELRMPLLGLTRGVTGEGPHLWRTVLSAPDSLNALSAAGAAGFEIGPLPEDWAGLASELNAWSALAFEEDHTLAPTPGPSSTRKKAAPRKKSPRK
jgi:hypothetical protein